MFVVNKNPSKTELRKFGAAMLGGFTVIAVAMWWKSWHRSGVAIEAAPTGINPLRILAPAMFAVGVALFAMSRLSESITKKVNVAWMSVFVPVGIFMSTIMLTLVFIIALPIFSIMIRLNNPLRKKLKSGGTYWEDYKPFEPTLERMKRLF